MATPAGNPSSTPAVTAWPFGPPVRSILCAATHDGNLEVFLYDSTTLSYTQVTSSTGSILGGFNLWPTLNASGTLMAFASDRDLTGGNSDGNFEIFVADVSGTGTPTLTQITHVYGWREYRASY